MEKEKVKERMKESGEGEVCDLCKREKEDMNLKNWETHLQACKRKKKAKDEKEKTKKVSTRKRKKLRVELENERNLFHLQSPMCSAPFLVFVQMKFSHLYRLSAGVGPPFFRKSGFFRLVSILI